MKQFNRACNTEEETKEVIGNLDVNHDGKIDFMEFKNLVHPSQLNEGVCNADAYHRIVLQFFDRNENE